MSPPSLKKEVLARLRTLALGNLFFFIKVVLGYPQLSPKLHGDVCRFLMGLTQGVALLNLPRGFLKSTIVSIGYPLWLATRNPDVRILIESKSMSLAMDSINEIRGRVTGAPLYAALFPDRMPNLKDKTIRWSTKAASLARPREWKEATFEAAGAGTRIVGRHYHLIIEDDPIYPTYDQMTGEQSEPSDEDVQKAIGWHDLRIPLFIPPADERLTLLAGTRWKKHDFLQHILNITPDLVSFVRASVENGNAIFPEIYPLEKLNTLRTTMSRYTWASQYMNQPIADEDIVFREEWIRTFERPPNGLRKIIVVDPAISQHQHACDSAIVVVGVAENNRRYVLDAWAKRVNAPDLMREIFAKVRYWYSKEDTSKQVGVESVSYQLALAQFLREEMHRRDEYFTVIELKPKPMDHDKDHRIRALVPYFENGSIFIREDLIELRRQILDYPGPKVDLVDALAWHLPLVKARLPEPRFLEDKNPFLCENILAEVRRLAEREHVRFGSHDHLTLLEEQER